jgi:hypothetical protein
VSRCSYCHRELPGLETLRQQCFAAQYDQLLYPKPSGQRVQLRPKFTRDNLIGFFLLFTFVFASLRFDLPYFHARHMRTTETSALISILIACLAFFHQGGGKERVAPSSIFEYKMNWRRFALLVVAEAVVGLFLYALFTFIPVELQVLISMACWVIVRIERWTFPKNKSLASLLCAVTGVAVFLCWLAWRITHEQVWSSLGFVGVCLMAGLIFLDRRQEWLDS